MIYFFGHAIMRKGILSWRRIGARANHLLAAEANTNAVNTLSTGASGGTGEREGKTYLRALVFLLLRLSLLTLFFLHLALMIQDLMIVKKSRVWR